MKFQRKSEMFYNKNKSNARQQNLVKKKRLAKILLVQSEENPCDNSMRFNHHYK